MKRIVVLGGGFAGIESAIRLRRSLPSHEVFLINDDDCFTFSPLLYEVAAGELSESDSCILIPSIMRKKNVIYYHDSASKIDLKRKYVVTKNLEEIPFDVLVLAVGAVTNFSGIEGSEKVFPLKTKQDAERIFEKVSNCIEKRKPHNFVVCGAGLTGIEFATTLKDHLDLVCRQRKIKRSDFKISILHGPSRILPNMPEKASLVVQNYLSKIGIELVCGFYTKKVLDGKLVSREGKEFSGDTVVWAGGITTNSLIIESGLLYSGMAGERGSPGGGAIVNSFLQCEKYPFVFALGDCVCIKGKEEVQKTAQNAVEQAKVIEKNVASFLKGSKMSEYKPKEGKFYCAVGKELALYVSGKKIFFGKKVRREKEKQEKIYVKKLSMTAKPSSGIYKRL